MTSTRRRCPYLLEFAPLGYLLEFAPLGGDGNDFYEGTE